MAIIKCPECGKDISDKADVCIHCGYPLNRESAGSASGIVRTVAADETEGSFTEQETVKSSKKLVLWGIIAGAILLIAAAEIFIIKNKNVVGNRNAIDETPKEAVNLPISVSIEGVSYDGTFSGQELLGNPFGECTYTFGDGAKQWTFIGEIDEGGKLTGTVEKMPVTVNAGFGDTQSTFTGTIFKNTPNGTIEVVDMPYKYEYDTVTFSGTFSGTTVDSLPEGKGEFNGNNTSDYLYYLGEWAKGKMEGPGKLKSNHTTIHFSKHDRTGKYEGDVVNGVLEGEGTFSATTDDGINYTYKGSFKNGLWDGQGSQIYEDESTYPHIGNFSKGDFKPSLVETLSSISQRKDSSFNIPTSKLSFFEKNLSLFTNGSLESANTNINKDFRIADFAKNPGSDNTKIAKINMRIFQVIEDEMWGHDYTRVLGSKSGYTYYCCYFGKSDKLIDNKSVTLYVMPLDYSTYRGVNGSDYWAAFCLISSIG